MIPLLIVALLAGSAPAPRIEPPSGFRYPTESDYSGDWKEFRKTTPVPFHVSADFNGDGLEDNAWLLLSTQGKGWALYMFIGSKDPTAPLVQKLFQDDRGTPVQRMGLGVYQPGNYDTACGKEYSECMPGEPSQLRLTRPALDLFAFESANSVFWWSDERKEFVQTWMHD